MTPYTEGVMMAYSEIPKNPQKDFSENSDSLHSPQKVASRNLGFPGDSSGKELLADAGDLRDMDSIPGSGRFPWEGNGKPTPVILPGESHVQRSLGGYGPWDCTESDTTEAT